MTINTPKAASLSPENRVLVDQLKMGMKAVVLAGELEWLMNAARQQERKALAYPVRQDQIAENANCSAAIPQQSQPVIGDAHRHPMVPALREAIADGFSNGNEQYDDASEPQQRRYDMVAYAVVPIVQAALTSQPVISEEAIERFRTWYFQHSGKRIFYRNAEAALTAALITKEPDHG